MLANLPVETTQLLIDLCTNSSEIFSPEVEEMSIMASKTTATAPSYLSYLALNRTSVVDVPPPSPSIKTVKPGDAVSQKEPTQETSRPSTPPPTTPTTTKPAPAPVKQLSPRMYFAHFVDHMDQFVIFLETVALRRWGQSVDNLPKTLPPSDPPVDEKADQLDQVAVWNTLLELYLTLPNPKNDTSANAEDFREKAMRVLNSDTIPYDRTHALILCSTRGYTEGLVLLWERMGLYEDVLRFWMDREKEGTAPSASAEVVKHLKQYGPGNPQLYPLVLRFLTSTPELLTRHQEDVKDVLEHINQEGIMPPLGVIQVLSRNSVASVGLVKEWLMTRITEARSEIQTVRDFTRLYSFLSLTFLVGPGMDELLQDGDDGQAEAGTGPF